VSAVNQLRLGSLCTGYGGLDLAVELVLGPLEHVWHADNDLDAGLVLTHHWAGVPNLGDLTTTDWAGILHRYGPVDVLTAGYPCQPYSVAGQRKGAADDRAIWPNIAAAIGVLRPGIACFENVPGHLGRGFDRVLWDLAHLGYVGSWVCVRAAGLGAPHRRERLFIAAWPADAHPGHGPTVQPVPLAERGSTAQPGDVGSRVGLNGHPTNAMLPTPAGRLGDRRGQPTPALAATRQASRANLDDAVALLPTPAARDWKGRGWTEQEGRPLSETVIRLLPSPTAADGLGGPGHSGRDGAPNLCAEVTLLPTPTAMDGRAGAGNPDGRSPGNRYLRTIAPTLFATDSHQRWGQYEAAIHRWESILGRAAPAPTETGKRGGQRLSPAFVEWLMGLPEGWVTAVPGVGRNAALRLLGNGVVPAQGAAAYRHALIMSRVSSLSSGDAA
jgi:DNA (cytosine-5)-methyltransferase 1